MKISLLVVGKTTTRNIAEGIDEYAKRISHYVPFEIVVIPDLRRGTRSLSEQQQKQREGEGILAAIAPTDRVILLDERGNEYTSREFAAMIERAETSGCRRLVFIVGGPYGFSKDVYDRADGMMSLSRMTFPHELIRLIFTEQLYRARTIIRGEPYHHD